MANIDINVYIYQQMGRLCVKLMIKPKKRLPEKKKKEKNIFKKDKDYDK